MSDVHIDAVLGPERNPRQGVGAADILRWQEGWRRQKDRGISRNSEPAPAVVVETIGDMDRFFAKVDTIPDDESQDK